MDVIEVFKSIQGEGKTQGRECVFIRFPNCNLKCLFCDSKYTWKNIKNIKKVSFSDKIFTKSDNIVFTGGEPFLQKNLQQIKKFISIWNNKNYEIETNGTILLSDDMIDFLKNNENKILFNISPKINIKQEECCQTEPIFITQIKHLKKYEFYNNIDYIVKFLFKDEEDLKYIKDIQKKYYIDKSKIWCQPCGTSLDTLKKTTLKYFDKIINENWNISLRLHVFLFDNRRGV